MSDTTDVLAADKEDTTDVLAADTTDVFSADTTAFLSADTTDDNNDNNILGSFWDHFGVTLGSLVAWRDAGVAWGTPMGCGPILGGQCDKNLVFDDDL